MTRYLDALLIWLVFQTVIYSLAATIKLIGG